MDYIFGPYSDWSKVDDLLSGCCCDEICRESCACARYGFAYDAGRLSEAYLQSDATYPIFECNQSCSCSQHCRNRLVQRFLTNPSHLVVRNIADCAEERGLFTEKDIPAGGFVCVFLGEVVSAAEAARREEEQKRQFHRTYVLSFCERGGDLDAAEHWTFVDGKVDVGVTSERWPVAAFANHSCDPSCVLLPVRVDRMLPYLVLFAARPLRSGEEVTFDYAAGDAKAQLSERRCFCRTARCRGFLPRNASDTAV